MIPRFVGLGLILFTGACASLMRPGPGDAMRDWPSALSTAQARAQRGEFEGADSLLAGFAAAHPGTHEALETAYWRGLFKLDPSNRAASVQGALASLDGYLASTKPRQHVVEATTLRRAAAQLQELSKLAASAASQASNASTAASAAKAVAADAKDAAKSADANASAVADAKDNEIRRLKEELTKANAELDRIRKRLSQPPH